MKELKSDLSNAKVGDWVLDLHQGWVRVVRHEGLQYPITTPRNKTYYSNGHETHEDKYPICFPADQVPPELLALYGPPPCEFKRGDHVIVGYKENSIRLYRIFKKYRPDLKYPYIVYNFSDSGSRYDYCEKWEGEE